MNKTFFFLLLLLLVVVGCTPEKMQPTTLQGELEELKIPSTYTAKQTNDNVSVSFTVIGEKVRDVRGVYTITDIKKILLNDVSKASPLTALQDFGCYGYGIGKEIMKICFQRKHLTYYAYENEEENVIWELQE